MWARKSRIGEKRTAIVPFRQAANPLAGCRHLERLHSAQPLLLPGGFPVRGMVKAGAVVFRLVPSSRTMSDVAGATTVPMRAAQSDQLPYCA
jgi:hypothetical protein